MIFGIADGTVLTGVKKCLKIYGKFIYYRKIYIHECFESFFQGKIYFFHTRAEQARQLNTLREAFFNKTLFIKNQFNESCLVKWSNQKRLCLQTIELTMTLRYRKFAIFM